LGAETQQLVLARTTASGHQLAEVLADFWFNHFNVFYGKGLVRPYLSSYVEEVIRPGALGRFEELLIATAEHPAMLFYLDNAQSVAEGVTPPNLQQLERARRQIRRPAQARRLDSLMQAVQQRMPGLDARGSRDSFTALRRCRQVGHPDAFDVGGPQTRPRLRSYVAVHVADVVPGSV